jgi:hypothetical protein
MMDASRPAARMRCRSVHGIYLSGGSRALNLGVSIRAIFSQRWLPDGEFQDLVQMGRRKEGSGWPKMVQIVSHPNAPAGHQKCMRGRTLSAGKYLGIYWPVSGA